ncbi:MAG: ferrous iron transport protein A [Clostridiaceae bacterium]|nr:ferrous iron transport protein A [Clostridiaceae bacterium]
MTLKDMKIGEEAVISTIKGGYGIHAKLESMGLREGSRITKKSAVFAGGPVIVQAGSTQIAIGDGMANRIIVETVD